MPSLDRLWAGWRAEYVTRVQSTSSLECVFCDILGSGLADEETHVLWRHPSAMAVAVLNAYPYTPGHLMVMPTRHTADLEDLDADEGAALWETLRMGVLAIKSAFAPDGLNVGANLGRVAGAGVPGHLHLHAVPRWSGDTNFMTTVGEVRVLPESLSESAAKLRHAWPAGDA